MGKSFLTVEGSLIHQTKAQLKLVKFRFKRSEMDLKTLRIIVLNMWSSPYLKDSKITCLSERYILAHQKIRALRNPVGYIT